jgi:hypothetical protein
MVYHKKLPKVRLPGNTRRFSGKLFKQHEWYTSKLVANAAAKNLKALGYNVRITLRPKSKAGGYPLTNLWYVWKRKG